MFGQMKRTTLAEERRYRREQSFSQVSFAPRRSAYNVYDSSSDEEAEKDRHERQPQRLSHSATSKKNASSTTATTKEALEAEYNRQEQEQEKGQIKKARLSNRPKLEDFEKNVVGPNGLVRMSREFPDRLSKMKSARDRVGAARYVRNLLSLYTEYCEDFHYAPTPEDTAATLGKIKGYKTFLDQHRDITRNRYLETVVYRDQPQQARDLVEQLEGLRSSTNAEDENDGQQGEEQHGVESSGENREVSPSDEATRAKATEARSASNRVQTEAATLSTAPTSNARDPPQPSSTNVPRRSIRVDDESDSEHEADFSDMLGGTDSPSVVEPKSRTPDVSGESMETEHQPLVDSPMPPKRPASENQISRDPKKRRIIEEEDEERANKEEPDSRDALLKWNETTSDKTQDGEDALQGQRKSHIPEVSRESVEIEPQPLVESPTQPRVSEGENQVAREAQTRLVIQEDAEEPEKSDASLKQKETSNEQSRDGKDASTDHPFVVEPKSHTSDLSEKLVGTEPQPFDNSCPTQAKRSVVKNHPISEETNKRRVIQDKDEEAADTESNTIDTSKQKATTNNKGKVVEEASHGLKDRDQVEDHCNRVEAHHTSTTIAKGPEVSESPTPKTSAKMSLDRKESQETSKL